jgi:MFS family permease
MSYWLVTLSIMFFYNGVFPFVADASLFVQDKYGFSSDTSSMIAGGVYDMSLVLAPFCGLLVDRIGRRGILAFLCAILSVPVFGLLAFTCVYPLIPILWFGATYSVAASTLWPSIPLVVPLQLVGTAMGVATTVQMIGIGVSNVIVGKLEDLNRGNGADANSSSSLTVTSWLSTSKKSYGKCADHKHSKMTLTDIPDTTQSPVPDRNWEYIMIFLFANIVACVVVVILLNIRDSQMGYVLNRTRVQRRSPVRHEADTDEKDDESDNDMAKLLPNAPFEHSEGQIQ